MPPGAATSDTHRLLWHGEQGPCSRIAAIVDGSDGGPLRWAAADPGHWRTEVILGQLPGGTLCVPSLILGEDDVSGYRMRLTWGTGGVAELVAIGVSAGAESIADWPRAHHGPVGHAGQRAEAGIDCLEAIDTLTDCRLGIEVTSPTCPRDLQLAVSLRQRQIEVPAAPGSWTPELAVPPLSQMTRDAAIARQICSPLSVAMVLASLGIHRDPEAFARDSFQPQHGMFGIWPANLAAAWRAGASGVVRSFDAAEDAARLLVAGYPIVASIRFEAEQLIGAPLPRSSGHLVVLRGLGADTVTVNDPAGADAESVVHHYDRNAFLRAWLQDRGVGYVLWPRRPSAECAQP
ncbi:MAG: C39 family peptidase [Gammaproteobacteria bacterium]|nr:C39 family peptidase [Gammaproteobacteria bacterium]